MSNFAGHGIHQIHRSTNCTPDGRTIVSGQALHRLSTMVTGFLCVTHDGRLFRLHIIGGENAAELGIFVWHGKLSFRNCKLTCGEQTDTRLPQKQSPPSDGLPGGVYKFCVVVPYGTVSAYHCHHDNLFRFHRLLGDVLHAVLRIRY